MAITDLKILWPLNHQITTDQYNGLVELFGGEVTVDILNDVDSDLANQLKNTPPSIDGCSKLADKLLSVAGNYDFIVFPVGSPAFQDVFHSKNASVGVPRLYSDTKRDSIDVVQADGSIVKKAVFKHRAWLISY